MMKAMVNAQYGSPEVLQLNELPIPEPGDHDVLIRVHATAVNIADVRLRKADPWAVRLFFGLTRPRKKVLGGVFSGTIIRVGKEAKLFSPGDVVFGSTDLHFGAFAEYMVLPQDGPIALKPTEITHREAAVIPFGVNTVMHFFKKAQIKPGQKVLINGASGAVGTAAIQIAKYFGAEVTGICSTGNLELVRNLGADHVIDYTRDDFSTQGKQYDVIMDTVGKLSYSAMLKSLKADGTLILSSAGMGSTLRGMWTNLTSKRSVLAGVIKETAANVNFVKGLIETGRYQPVIDRTYSLEQMPLAHTYTEQGHKKGNVAITIYQAQ